MLLTTKKLYSILLNKKLGFNAEIPFGLLPIKESLLSINKCKLSRVLTYASSNESTEAFGENGDFLNARNSNDQEDFNIQDFVNRYSDAEDVVDLDEEESGSPAPSFIKEKEKSVLPEEIATGNSQLRILLKTTAFIKDSNLISKKSKNSELTHHNIFTIEHVTRENGKNNENSLKINTEAQKNVLNLDLVSEEFKNIISKNLNDLKTKAESKNTLSKASVKSLLEDAENKILGQISETKSLIQQNLINNSTNSANIVYDNEIPLVYRSLLTDPKFYNTLSEILWTNYYKKGLLLTMPKNYIVQQLQLDFSIIKLHPNGNRFFNGLPMYLTEAATDGPIKLFKGIKGTGLSTDDYYFKNCNLILRIFLDELSTSIATRDKIFSIPMASVKTPYHNKYNKEFEISLVLHDLPSYNFLLNKSNDVAQYTSSNKNKYNIMCLNVYLNENNYALPTSYFVDKLISKPNKTAVLTPVFNLNELKNATIKEYKNIQRIINENEGGIYDT